MTDRCDANCVIVVSELIDDAIRADFERAEAVQPSMERMSGVRVPFEQRERLLHRVDERPVEVEQLLSGTARENDFGHASAGRSTLGEVTAKIVERDAVASRELGQASLDGGERRRVRQDLRGLFERFILVYRNERRGRSAVASHEDVITAVGDVAQQLAELRSEFSNRNHLRHRRSVPYYVHHAPCAN